MDQGFDSTAFSPAPGIGAGVPVETPVPPRGAENAAQDALTAQLVWDTYHNCMRDRYGTPLPRKQFGKKSGKGKDSDAIIEIAELCQREGWDPEQYVKNSIDRLHQNHHYIKPRDLLKDVVIDKFRSDVVEGKVSYDPIRDWEYLTRALISYIETAQASETAILLSPMTPFPAWFRLTYPELLDPQIFEWWGEDGRRQLLHDWRLRMFLRKVAPKAFAQLEAHWGKFGDVEKV